MNAISNIIRLSSLRAFAGSPKLTEQLLREPIYFPTWPLSPTEGRKIIKRNFNFCGYSIEMAGHINWNAPNVSIDWQREFFSYKWLQDVAAINSDKVSSSFAREFINAFTLITKQDDVHESAWELDVVGERLTHWLYYRHFVLKGGSEKFFIRYQKSLIKHVTLLYHHAVNTPEYMSPNAIKGLIAASSIIPSCAFMLDDAIELLKACLKRDILPDGGHISQSPQHHLSFTKTMIEVRELLETADKVCEELNKAIAQLGTMLDFFCHGDGRLALFHHNLLESANVIERAIELSYAQKAPPIIAEYSGYAKLKEKNTCMFLRTARTDARHLPLGISAIELSDGKERIFVNCGMYYGASMQWQDALSHPSAYSTLYMEHNEDVLYGSKMHQQHVLERASRKIVEVNYDISPSLVHERHIEMSDDGMLCKGRDFLHGAEGATIDDTMKIFARFHLHPDVRCQSQKEGSYILKLVSGAQWQFTSTFPTHISIEESVYLGYYGKPQKTLQLVIAVTCAELAGGLRWEMKKLVT
jgi:uncharacterized heparinase superfamily protein